MNLQRTWPLFLPAAAVVSTGLLYGLSRTFSAWGYECGLLTLFKIYCPGCGGTRCARSLAAGDFSSAFGYNALLTLGVMAFALGSLYLIIRVSLLGRPAPASPAKPWILGALALVIIFTILRNTEACAWLAP